MKLGIYITLFLSCFSLIVSAQISAITETGDAVVLYNDGTWTYVDGEALDAKEIPTNKKKFEKDKASTFLLKSNKVDLGFYLDPKKWTFTKAKSNEEAEYELQLKDADLYGMIITEKFEMPLETLRNLALENGRSVAPDLKIMTEEYRMVNGLKVLFLQMNGSTQGIKFSYFGYYFSSELGTVQFITYTSQNLLSTYEKDCEKLLSGLVPLKD